MSQNPWDDHYQIAYESIEEAALFQATTKGTVRFYVDKYMEPFTELASQSQIKAALKRDAEQSQAPTQEPSRTETLSRGSIAAAANQSLIDVTDMQIVKRYLRAGRDIQEVILVRPGEDLAKVAAELDCDPETRKARGFALASAVSFALQSGPQQGSRAMAAVCRALG